MLSSPLNLARCPCSALPGALPRASSVRQYTDVWGYDQNTRDFRCPHLSAWPASPAALLHHLESRDSRRLGMVAAQPLVLHFPELRL